jgi:uncharacterized protein YhaN
MKLHDLQVDGFGVWSELSLSDLSPHCTVFYGPNEAGKTTLLEFLRAVLYGFSPQRAARYLPPLRGATAGGFLTVSTADEGRLRIGRCERAQQPSGSVIVEAPDGTVQSEGHLRRLLHDVDEAMFQNVFAVGLQELQELGTLTDSDAARWLYHLTVGLDRVSLCHVLSELDNSRRRLWSDQQDSQISQLLTQRDRLRTEVAELSNLSLQLEQLLAQRSAADQQITQLESALAEQDATHRTWETVAALHEPWQRRHKLNAQIETLGPAAQWPADAVGRMERLSAAAGRARRKKRRFAHRRKMLADELNQIKLNQPLWRQAARIEALAENETWIVSLEQEIQQAEETVKRLTAERLSQQDLLNSAAHANVDANSPQQAIVPRQIDRPVWQSLRRPAAALSQAKRLAQEEQQKTEHERTAQQSRRQELDQALAAKGQKNLTVALEAAGQRVTQLRRRLQLDELTEQLSHTKGDLEHSISGYLERQILPPWMLLSLGGIFVLGVVLILGGLLLPGSFTGSLGWPMAWLGLLGVGSAIAAKYTMERSAANQLEASRRQLALVESQSKQAQTERSDLDRLLPKTGGPLAAQLQTAQQELAKLEELLPLEAQRQAVEQAAQDSESRRAQARQSYQQALENWQAALAAHGLPEYLTPAQVRGMFNAGGRLNALQRQLADAQSELDRRRRELTAFTSRLEQVFLAAEILPQATAASQQLRQLRHELADQESRHKRREIVLRRQRKLRRRQQGVAQRLRRLRNRCRQLLRDCHVADLAEFRRRSAEFSQIASLITQRDSAAQEIAALLVGRATTVGIDQETAIASLVANATAEQVATQLAGSRHRLEETRRQQQRLFEERGRRNEQIRLLSGDRRQALKRFELAQVEQRISAAVSRWQVLTLTYRWLELIKQHYERHRQPETLREASKYLAQFTGGRYQRVWTRWGENTLLVDDDRGHTLSIEVLSRGTREQLFLSLRMALVGLFARRGVELPMVLDDVLVNFDSQRAAAAVQVLHDFSQRGHQLLVFTCHEHLARLFKATLMDVRRLPSDHQSGRDQPFVVELQLPPRRSRLRRVREESDLPPVVVDDLPPPSPPPYKPPAAEPSVALSLPVPLRLDMPQQVVRPSPVMRRWAFWQDVEDQPAAANGPSPEAEQQKSTTVDRIKTLKFITGEPVPIVVAQPTDDKQ